MKIGTKIVITAKDHPHYGEAGEIAVAADSKFKGFGFDWVIDLDSGSYTSRCFVADTEIREV